MANADCHRVSWQEKSKKPCAYYAASADIKGTPLFITDRMNWIFAPCRGRLPWSYTRGALRSRQ